jgi:hypothetical protein
LPLSTTAPFFLVLFNSRKLLVESRKLYSARSGLVSEVELQPTRNKTNNIIEED